VPHATHAEVPLAILYVPAPHGEHGPPSGPVYPALQEQPTDAVVIAGESEFIGHTPQVDAAVAPTTAEYVPVPQFKHAAVPLAILYFPATHAEHGPPSGPVNPALQPQAETAELDAGEMLFAGHATHVNAVVAAVAAEYIPVPQSLHAALPLAILYFPTPQAEHVPPFGPVNPALQVQAVDTELAVGALEFTGHVAHVDAVVAAVAAEYVAAPQSLHAALPLAVLYLPATHAEHVPPSGPVYPGEQAATTHGPPAGPVYPVMQVQAVTAVLGLGDIVFAGQVKQVDATVAPAVPEYVPAPQSVHVPLPLAILYFPATHALHTPPFGPVYPALQAQAVTTVLVPGEFELPGHARQVVTPVAADVPEYVPTPQLLHATLPVVLLYLPAAHGEHVPPSGPVYPALQATTGHVYVSS
jgi:hypothetical protein